MSIGYAQSHAYSDAIARAGGTPVILPIAESLDDLRDLYDRCDGIVLSGGGDINPARYGQATHPKTVEINDRQDDQDFRLAQWALDDDKPILGICRGLQLLNVQCGGTLVQHIPEALPHAHNHEVSVVRQDTTALAHTLQVETGSQLAKILAVTEIAANSQHHQAVDSLGSGLVVNARAEDGVIEGVELPSARFAVAVQPHPEGLEAAAEVIWRRLFEAFVQAASYKTIN